MEKNNLSDKEYKRLNNFYWFFSLDLKSSKKVLNQSLQVGLITILNIKVKAGIMM